MNYFYSTRLDKSQNVLLTSYSTKKDVEKYGGGGKIEHTQYFLDLESGSITNDNVPEAMLLRSVLINKGEVTENKSFDNPFSVMVKENGKWKSSGQTFPQYGMANNVMKSLINHYEATAVVYTGNSPVEPYTETTELSVLG